MFDDGIKFNACHFRCISKRHYGYPIPPRVGTYDSAFKFGANTKIDNIDLISALSFKLLEPLAQNFKLILDTWDSEGCTIAANLLALSPR